MSLEIVLASSSPRRRALLKGLGITFDVMSADIDESVLENETAEALVARLSLAKARAIQAQKPNALVIAADTVVVLQTDILGKPRDANENRYFLERLSAQPHTVFTGHALLFKDKKELNVKQTKVYFRDLTKEEMDWYVATREGLDKAGGYGIQGKGAALVPYIEGCYFNVMGLSVAAVLDSAKKLGVNLV